MNNTIRKPSASALWAAALILCGAGTAEAVVLSLAPASTEVDPGDSVSLELVISGLDATATGTVGAFDIDLSYDTAALTFDGYALGSLLGDVGTEALDFSFGDVGGGIINLAELSLLETSAATCIFCIGPYLDDLQSDTFTLATLDFTVDALAEGTSTIIGFSEVYALGNGAGRPLQIEGTRNARLFNPGVGVPEPSVLLLLGAGLVAGRLVGRRISPR
jgi:hypothetical protein